MNQTLTKIEKLTATFPPEEREAIEAELLAVALEVVAAHKAEAEKRDALTQQGLEDIAAGRVMTLNEWQKDMKIFMENLKKSTKDA